MEITSEAAKLAIANAKIISESYQVMRDIDDSLHTYILDRIKKNIDDIDDDEEWWMEKDCFGPTNWSSEDDYLVYYKLAWWGSSDFWTLHASGTDDRGLGLALFVEPSLLNKDAYTNSINKLFATHAKKFSGARLIPCYGKNRSYLVFPFKPVDIDALADSYPDWDDSLAEIIDDAFNLLTDAHSTIDTFVRKLKI